MSAQVFHLSEVIASRHAHATDRTVKPDNGFGIDNISFWTGASGRRYVHTVFNLMSCPELPAANYVLVRRGHDGEANALKVGVVEHAASSLNLAELRHRAARLGANEIHVHLLASRSEARAATRVDLSAGLIPAAHSETVYSSNVDVLH